MNHPSTKLLKECQYENQVVRLVLHAPRENILDREMMKALQAALDELDNQPQVKLVTLEGSGEHFSFGASVGEHAREHVAGMLKQFHQLFYTLADLAIPSAALVRGYCLGGGFELALMCNFLFADRTARLGQPEITLGVFAPPASLLLPMKIGATRAEDLLLTGRTLTAEEALGKDLVTGCFEDSSQLEKGFRAWVEKHILPKSASSLRYAVRAARRAFNATLREQVGALEGLYLKELMLTHDANEGIAAFLEKRPPRWENR